MNPNAGEQQSLEWLLARCGKITASRFHAVVARQKNDKPYAAYETYLMELVIERLTGRPTSRYTSEAMMWGQEQEDVSRMAYEGHTHAMVEQVGFLPHPDLDFVGGSPDGLIGEDGGWESKSPFNSANHLYTVLDGMPEEHVAQVQGLMWITGRKWWDFTSYDPRMPAPLDLYVQRIERNQEYIDNLQVEIIAFDAKVNEIVTKLRPISVGAEK